MGCEGRQAVQAVAFSRGFPLRTPADRGVMLRDIAAAYESFPAGTARRNLAPCPLIDCLLRRAERVEEIAPGFGAWSKSFLGAHGLQDVLGVFGAGLGGVSAVVLIPLLEGRRPIALRTRDRLSFVAAHLGKGLCLRRAMAQTSAHGRADALTEGMLDTYGKPMDTRRYAQPKEGHETLLAAVRRMDLAHGALRRADPGEALRLWQGLVDGSWSLVEHVDSEGQHCILARRNTPGIRDAKALTARERFVVAYAAMGHRNKYIACLLRSSNATVAAHLASAQRKLGLSSRAELIRLFSTLAEAPEGAERRPRRRR
jgi:DNA-binding CsgD family transcriptional regulator